MADDLRRIGQGLRELLEGFTSGTSDAGGPAGRIPPPAAREAGLQSQFPPGGIDFIRHELRVHMASEKTGFSEILDMTGAMVVQRADPEATENGRRKVDFKVLSWSATGWSHKLGAAITYVLSQDVEQPTSTIESERDGFDFPASFLFKVKFDVRVNNETVFKSIEGRPHGHGFLQVPPTGSRELSPTITKFEDLGQVKMIVPNLGELIIKPIDCNDRYGETLAELPGTRLVALLGLAGNQ